jgi:hypothetical protein
MIKITNSSVNNIFYTISLYEISKTKLIDNFNFDKKEDEFIQLKISDYDHEVIIDKVKEIKINSIDNLNYLFK